MPFRVVDVDVPEREDGPPEEIARVNAVAKARAGAGHAHPGEIVVGVDTVVAIELEIWGKPPSEDAARETLRRLSGRTHQVVSAVAAIADGELRCATDCTDVTFRALDDETVEWYLRSGEWRGRAGGYAIQGRGGVLVSRIEGSYLNVVGLPVGALLELCPRLLVA